MDLGDAFSTDTQLLAIDMTLAQDDIDGSIFLTARRQASDYRGAFKSMLRNPVPDLKDLVDKHGKPIVSAFAGAPALVKEYRGNSKVPVYNSSEMAIKALAAYREFCARKKEPLPYGKAAKAPEDAVRKIEKMKPGLVTGSDAFAALKAAGVPVAPCFETKSEDKAADAAERFGYPVAMKIISPEIVHKTESGALALNIKNERKLRSEFKKLLRIMENKNIRGIILVQKMANPGTEAIIGSRRDPNFGQVLMFGLGGIFVEILKDVVFHLAPVNRDEALNMISSIKTASLLRGARNMPVADRSALADAIVAVGKLIVSCPRIEELDINPILVYEEGAGCSAVDARIFIK